MADEDTKNPGPDPERLVIEEEPGEALSRLLQSARTTGDGDWIELPEEGDLRLEYGRWEADVETGRRVRGVERYELHLVAGSGWRIRGGALLPKTDRILRCRWLGPFVGEWHDIAEGVPNPRRAVEFEDEEGARYHVPAEPSGKGAYVLRSPSESRPKATRWRYLD